MPLTIFEIVGETVYDGSFAAIAVLIRPVAMDQILQVGRCGIKALHSLDFFQNGCAFVYLWKSRRGK
jgi:hypothetical protein